MLKKSIDTAELSRFRATLLHIDTIIEVGGLDQSDLQDIQRDLALAFSQVVEWAHELAKQQEASSRSWHLARTLTRDERDLLA